MTFKKIDIFDFLYDKLDFDINKPIRLFEAFSGIGTQAMALKRLGYQVEHVGISEIDKHALKSYNAIHGEVKNYGGIGSFERMPKDIDICSWSFPCQDISIAGKQRGMVDGSRSNYGYVFLDTIENTPYEERPKVLLMENVKALLSETFSEDWKEINLRLEKLGYKNYADSLIATDFGIPQTRDRVFIVSIKGEYSYTFPKPIPLVKRLKDYLEDEVDEKYYLSDKQIKRITESTYQTNARRIHDPNGIVGTLCARDYKDPKCVALPNETATTLTVNPKVNGKQPSVQDRIYDSRGVSTTITTSYHPNVLILPEKTKKGFTEAEEDGVYLDRPHQKRGVVQKDKIQTIKTSVNDIGVVVKDTRETIYSDKSVDKILSNIVDVNGVSKTITANPQRATIDSATLVVSNPPLKIRKLTPLEAWRLMGIDDEDFYKAKASGMSDSQLYKQAGNAIVVDVLYYIFKQFIKGE